MIKLNINNKPNKKQQFNSLIIYIILKALIIL